MESIGTMSAATSSSASTMASEQRAHEPSMEEILASIRRIIADDQVLPLTKTQTVPAEATAEPAPAPIVAGDHESPPALEHAGEPEDHDIPHQTPEWATPRDPDLAAFERELMSVPQLRPVLPPRVAKPAPPPATPVVEEQPEDMDDGFHARAATAAAEPSITSESLLSASAGASVSSAFNALATTMLLQNSAIMEDAVRDMLRPMLKQWLDDNLPVVVERLVRGEIERVARGGRG